ncbi:hypothetical protein K488DRAFT_75368, partial [Vararia minispora EC-137]
SKRYGRMRTLALVQMRRSLGVDLGKGQLLPRLIRAHLPHILARELQPCKRKLSARCKTGESSASLARPAFDGRDPPSSQRSREQSGDSMHLGTAGHRSARRRVMTSTIIDIDDYEQYPESCTGRPFSRLVAVADSTVCSVGGSLPDTSFGTIDPVALVESNTGKRSQPTRCKSTLSIEMVQDANARVPEQAASSGPNVRELRDTGLQMSQCKTRYNVLGDKSICKDGMRRRTGTKEKDLRTSVGLMQPALTILPIALKAALPQQLSRQPPHHHRVRTSLPVPDLNHFSRQMRDCPRRRTCLRTKRVYRHDPARHYRLPVVAREIPPSDSMFAKTTKKSSSRF